MFELIIGASGSGKSEYAEEKCVSFGGRRIYLATMMADDPESLRRIDRHRRMRAGRGFETVECYTHLEELELEPGRDVLLECLSNLAANEMFSEDGRAENTADVIMSGIVRLKSAARNLIIVSNNVFEDGIEYDDYSMRYMKLLGDINNRTALMADTVTEVVCGINIEIKNIPENRIYKF